MPKRPQIMLAREDDDWLGLERAYDDSPEQRSLEPDPARLIVEPRGFFASPVALP